MKTTKAFSLSILAAFLWSCNDPAPTTSAAQSDQRVVRGVNTLTKAAADRVGLQAMSQEPIDENPFSEIFSDEVIAAMRAAGICENFILLAQELAGLDQNGGSVLSSPRFMNAAACMESYSSSFTAEPSEGEVMGMIENCFCAGSGSLFVGMGFTGYRAPRPPGGGYGTPGPSNVPYSRPQTSPGYSAPTTPGGQGYSAPSL